MSNLQKYCSMYYAPKEAERLPFCLLSVRKGCRLIRTINSDKFFLLALLLFELPLLLGERPDSTLALPGLVLLGFALAYHVKHKTLPAGLCVLVSRPIVSVIAVTMALLWALLIWAKFYSFGFAVFDTGIFAGEINSFLRTGSYHSSVLKMPGLSDHFTPMLLVLAPAFAFVNGLIVLHGTKLAATLVSGALLVPLSDQILGKQSRFRFAASGLWLVHSYVNRAVDFEFQPSSLAVPFVLLGALGLLKGKRIVVAACLVVLLGFKEQMSLLWICTGIAVFSRNRRAPWAYGLIFAGLAIGPLIYTQLMPWMYNGAMPHHSGRFDPLALMPEKILMIGKSLLSVGLLPLYAPQTLTWLVPSFGLSLLSNDPQMVSFGFHYLDIPLAATFVAALFGLKRFEESFSQRRNLWGLHKNQLALISVAAVVASNCWYPSRSLRKHFPSAIDFRLHQQITDLSSLLNSQCDVFTINSVGGMLYELPHLRMIFNSNQKIPSQSIVILPSLQAQDDLFLWPLQSSELQTLRNNLSAQHEKISVAAMDMLDLYGSKECLGRGLQSAKDARHSSKNNDYQ
jgi:uncharacterized membrane protein